MGKNVDPEMLKQLADIPLTINQPIHVPDVRRAELQRLPGEPAAVLPPTPIRIDYELEINPAEVFAKDYVDIATLHRLRTLIYERARRKVEAIGLYEALPEQERFHRSTAAYRIVRGSNRSGKTLSAAVEVARAVTGRDPYQKYPTAGGTAFIVGKDQKHVGTVLYAKLFRPVALKIIRDLSTKRWRAYRPWLQQDLDRESEARWAPPLIPERLIQEIAWVDKRENVPAVVRLRTGWDLYFFSSLGKPPQGSPIDLFWLDEEIIDPSWYPEMAARIVDRKGRGIWSATPQAGTDQLYDLHERAEEERVTLPEGKRRIEEFVVLLADNKHIDDASKKAMASDLSDSEARVRIGGEYAVLSYKVYPTFNMLVHGYPAQEVPPHWTRYAYVDPGHQVCAVLFAAVPPPAEGDFVLLYDELYIYEANASIFGEKMGQKCAGQQFQAFIIDYHFGIHTEAGIGKTVMAMYSEALVANKVRSIQTGSSFLFGSDDIAAGVLAVQGMLRVREGGKGPRLRVMEGKLPAFEREIKRYHRKRIGGVVQEQPDARKDNHLMDDLRYMAQHNPRYVPYKPERQAGGRAVDSYRLKLQRRKDRQGESYINLGPGGRFF